MVDESQVAHHGAFLLTASTRGAPSWGNSMIEMDAGSITMRWNRSSGVPEVVGHDGLDDVAMAHQGDAGVAVGGRQFLTGSHGPGLDGLPGTRRRGR